MRNRRLARWLAVGMLAAIPLGLAWGVRERASWRPRTLRTGLTQVDGATFSRDGRLLVVSGARGLSGVVQVWEAAREELVASLALPCANGSSNLALSPDGRLVACADAAGSWIWDARDGSLVRLLPGVSQVAFAPDGSALALNAPSDSSWNNGAPDVQRLDTRELQVLEALDVRPPRGFSFAFGGEAPWAGAQWSVSAQARFLALPVVRATLKPPEEGDEEEDHAGVLLLDLPRGTRRMLRTPAGCGWSGAASSPDGRLLAVSCRADTAIQARHPRRAGQVAGIRRASPQRPVCSGPGAAGWAYSHVEVWESATGRLLRRWKFEGSVFPQLLSADNTRLLLSWFSTGTSSTVRFHDVRNGRAETAFVGKTQINTSGGEPRLSPDGTLLAAPGYSESDSRALLWDARSGRIVRTLVGHSAAVRQVAFSPDGSTLATASHDGTVKLWRVR